MTALRRCASLVLAGTLLLPALLPAGGHMSVFNGQPVRYRPDVTIVYHLDKGAMGQFSNAVARNIASTSFQTWQDVATATIAFQLDSLSVDVNGSNFQTYLSMPDGSNYSDGLNPIVFDHDGSIIDGLIGAGASANVIGFAGSAFANAGPNAGFYVEGHAVMNGTMAVTQFTEAEFKSTFVHEFGHFIGLDHSQVNAPFAGDANGPNDQYLPTMYPTSSDDDTQLATLNPDDIASVSRLYPVASFASTTGTISGTVTRSDNAPVRGAVVVAVNVADSLLSQYSTVTDYLQQGSGAFSISGLPAGTYWLKMEPVRPAFIGGSSVGPYADDLTGLSFVNPVTAEYYNGAGEGSNPATDTASSRVTLTVSAGAGTAANLVANGEAPPVDMAILQDFGTTATTFSLPSMYDDRRYAVRFTPGRNAPLLKVDFLLRAAPEGIKGTGTLQVTVYSHKAGSVGGIPDAQLGSAVTRPFSSLTAGVTNEVDLTPLALNVQNGVNFHVVFAIVGAPGDTLKFRGDDASVQTTRSSSYYDAGAGFQWYNFIDASNFGTGFNLIVRAHLGAATSADEPTEVLLPDGFGLSQNYPNPFNPATIIPFRLAQAGVVSVDVVDLLGRHVATVIDRREYGVGDHQATFNADGLPSGTYIARLVFEGRQRFIRMVLVR